MQKLWVTPERANKCKKRRSTPEVEQKEQAVKEAGPSAIHALGSLQNAKKNIYTPISHNKALNVSHHVYYIGKLVE